MILPDINVLIYAHRSDALQHKEYKDWLEQAVASGETIFLPDHVANGFVRIVSNPKAFPNPTPIAEALDFLDRLYSAPNVRPAHTTAAYRQQFRDVCIQTKVQGPGVSDAHLASLALYLGAELISTDRDFARFPGLRWRHPLT